MRLSRLSNRQLKRLLARGEVRFGDSEFASFAKLAIEAKKDLYKFFDSGPIREMRHIFSSISNNQERRDFENTNTWRNFAKALDKLNEVYILLDKTKQDATQKK